MTDKDTDPAPPSPDPEKGADKKPKSFLGFFVVVTLVTVLVMVLGSKTLYDHHTKLTPGEFLRMVEQKQVKTAIMEGNRVVGDFQEGGKDKKFVCTLPQNLLVHGRRKIGEGPKAVELTLFEWLNANIEELRYRETNHVLYNFFLQLAPWLLLFAFIYFFFFRKMTSAAGGGGVLSFGRSRARLVSEEKVAVTFGDVAGIDEAKEEVEEIIQFLKNPSRFQRLGARIPRGVLLVGPPGTGKTLLAKAIAGEASVPFFSICGSDFVEMFVGVGASRVRDLFKQAKDKSPSIIFLDEIDAVGRRRGSGLGGGHDEREQTLNAILVEMDGFHTDQGVIVIAATNRPDVLDPALSRPGRFDREITIDLPDVKGREEILRVHSRRVKLARDVDLARIARCTPMYSGADLEAVINESALLAVMRGKDAVTMEELEEARDKVRWGREKKSRLQEEEDRQTTAVHEAGHAVVSFLTEHTEPLHKVSIIPRGRALGMTMYLPERDRYLMPRRRLLAMVKVLYGGRVAEEVLCSDIDGGAESDIEQATKLVRSMVCRWGMSDKLGPISYGANDETVFLGREITRTQVMSEETARRVDEEVQRIIGDCYREVGELVRAQQTKVREIADALMEYEVITGDEVTAIMRGEKIADLRRAAGPKKKRPETKTAAEAADAPAAESAGPTDRDLETGGELAY